MNDSANICAIEKILSLPVHLVNIPCQVPAPQIFTYGKSSDPRSTSHDSSAESVTPKGNPTPHNNPPNLLLKIPDEPD